MKIDPTFAETFRFKGIVLSAQELHDQALIAFSQANRIEKDMASYNGEYFYHSSTLQCYLRALLC